MSYLYGQQSHKPEVSHSKDRFQEVDTYRPHSKDKILFQLNQFVAQLTQPFRTGKTKSVRLKPAYQMGFTLAKNSSELYRDE